MTNTIDLKLNFLKRVLTDTVYDENIYYDFINTKVFPEESVMNEVIAKQVGYDQMEGLIHPPKAHTMIGLKRLDNVHLLLDRIKGSKIEGDLMETGVWRGGCCIFMAWYLKLHGIKKKVFVVDSFEGLPMPNTEKYPQDFGDQHFQNKFLSVSLEEVMGNFEIYDVMSDNIVFLKGWFENTLKDNDEIQKIALLRFDGDMYGSTMDVLNNVYNKVTEGGFVIIDDYCLPNCVKAVTDFRNQNRIENQINVVDQCGVYWQI